MSEMCWWTTMVVQYTEPYTIALYYVGLHVQYEDCQTVSQCMAIYSVYLSQNHQFKCSSLVVTHRQFCLSDSSHRYVMYKEARTHLLDGDNMGVRLWARRPVHKANEANDCKPLMRRERTVDVHQRWCEFLSRFSTLRAVTFPTSKLVLSSSRLSRSRLACDRRASAINLHLAGRRASESVSGTARGRHDKKHNAVTRLGVQAATRRTITGEHAAKTDDDQCQSPVRRIEDQTSSMTDVQNYTQWLLMPVATVNKWLSIVARLPQTLS